MEFVIEKSELIKSIQKVQGSLSGSSTLPILSGIYLEAINDNLISYSTDLNISIRDEVQISTKKAGKTVVLGKTFLELITNLDEGKINIFLEEEENKLIIKNKNSLFKINIFKAEEYPKFVTIEEENKVEVDNKELIESIKQVITSTSKDESRPTLTGILFDFSEDKGKMVSTDSYRLSYKEIKSNKNIEKTITVPKKALEETLKIVKSEGKSTLFLSEKQIMIKSEKTTLISKLIGGQYPNYKQLFPKEQKIKINVNRDELLRAIKRISVLSQNTPLNIKIKDSTITINNKNTDTGSGQEIINGIKNTGDIEVAFNSKYLIDGLSAINDKEIEILLNDPSQPGIIKSATTNGFKYLIMPVRLN